MAYGDTHPGTEHETKFLEWLGTLDVESFHQSGAQPAWKAQSYVYDVGKRLRGLTDPEIGLHDWTYDINNRLRTMQYGGQTVNEIDYTVGGLVDRTRLKDASGATIAETEHVYDGLGRKIRQETRKAGSGELLAGFEWAYDELDLVEEVRVLHVGAKGVFKYNERRELTEEVWTATTGGNAPPFANVFVAAPPGALESVPSNEAEGQLSTGGSGFTPVVKEYDYDPAGNRRWMKVDGAQTDYVYDSGSRLTLETRPGGVQVEHDYDEWGNETLRTTTSGASPTVVEAYGYNHLNLLSSYVKTTGGAESANWQYDYWPTGERCAKTNLAAGSTEGEVYVPRAGDVAVEYARDLSLRNVYVQGTGIDQKSLRISAAGQRRHYLGDQVGTVSVTLTDAAAVSETSLKDVWGNPLVGGTPGERYGFAQREHDGESGLVHMRARQYDPMTGRFTQTDPLRGNRPFEHYVYGFNNPVTTTDPMGLDGWSMPRQYYESAEFRKGFHGGAGGMPALPPKAVALIQGGVAALELKAAALLMAAPEPTGLSKAAAVWVGAHAIDMGATAVRTWAQDSVQETLHAQAAEKVTRATGAPEVVVQTVKTLADVGPGLLGGIAAARTPSVRLTGDPISHQPPGTPVSRVLNIGGEGEVPGAINLNSLIAPLRGIDEIVARGPLVKGDFLQLPFKSGAFSEVVGTRLPFMHGQFAEQTAAEAFRVLAPGGRVSLSASQGGSAVWTDYLKQAGFEVQVVGRQVTGVRP